MALKKQYEGELVVDHRASPGFTEEQSKRLGYPVSIKEGKVFEAPTMSCNHCGTVVIINPDRKRDREWCSTCDHYICDNCGLERKLSGYEHKTHMQKLQQRLIN